MANENRPSGLSPVQYLNGAPWNGQGRVYCIPSTDGNAYAPGDPVASAGSADANGIPTVILATAGTGNAIRGVILGAGGLVAGGGYFDPTNLNTTVIPATKTKDYYVLVADDPNIVFEVQEIGTGTTLTATEVGLNANLVAGTNNGYISGWLLNNVGEATGSTIQVKLLGLSQKMNGNGSPNAFGQYAKWLVKINNHELGAGTAGV